jgi:hypothetical protein
MEKRYTGLRLAGTVYKVIGIIAGIITILAAIGICLTFALGGAAFTSSLGSDAGAIGSFGIVGGLVGSLLVLIYGGVMSIGVYAFGELMHLMVSMEENTRATAMLLQKRTSQQVAASTDR